MRFTSSINNFPAKKWGLNIQEAYVFSFLYELPSWAEKLIIEGDVYYHGSRNKAIEEIPLLTDKPDTMYRHFKSLKDKGLIEFKNILGKDYIRLLPKSKEWNSSENFGSEKFPNGRNQSESSEKNPYELGKFSDDSSENFPTYNNTSIYNNTSNNNFLEKNSKKTKNSNINDLIQEEKEEKSCAKKEERTLHPCNPNMFLGDYIQGHGDGHLHLMILNYINSIPETSELYGLYPKEMLTAFKNYWSAPIINGKKKDIGLELWRSQKTFEISGRLSNWYRRENKDKKNETATTKNGVILQQPAGFNQNSAFEEAIAIARNKEEQRKQYSGVHTGSK